MRSPSRLIWLCLALCGALPAQRAYAQAAPPPAATAEAKAAAQAAADRGKEHYDAGKYEEAIASFNEADQHFHAPTFLLMIARANEKLGRLKDARAAYERVINEQLAHYAPQVFFEAQASARTELESLLPRIPSVQVLVTGAPADQVKLDIDGQPAPLGEAVMLDPGEHAVTASAAGREPVTQALRLQEAMRAQLTLELKAPPPPEPPKPAPPPKPVQQAAPPPKPAPLPPPAEAPAPARKYASRSTIVLAVGGLGLGVGALTLAMAAEDVSQLEKLCPNGLCYDDARDPYNSAQVLSVVSTMSFIAGGAVTAAGLGLLIYDSRKPAQATQTGLVAGPGWVGVKGRF